MSLSDIDTTRALRTDEELLALVEAIHSSPRIAQETNWLEWKSSLNLGVVEGRFAVAKAILGFANRSVAEAQRACEGVAYMVVGVEPGSAAGVANIDHASLSQGLKTYVDGVRWSLHYVEFVGVTVLVIVIEAPRSGDPIHTLQKTYDKHYAGTVFHRGAAQTEPAGPKVIAMLQERLLEGQRKPELDLAFATQAEPLARLSADSEDIEDWLRRHEAHIRANSGQPTPPAPPPASSETSPFSPLGISPLGSLAGLASSLSVSSIGAGGLLRNTYKPEDAEEFERRVEDYLAQLRTGLIDHLLRGVVQSDDNKVTFAVGNETDNSVTGVKLTVIIPQGGVLVYDSPPTADPLPRRMPKWPDALDKWMNNVAPPALANLRDYDFTLNGASVVDNDDSFEATWDIGDLRPGEWSRALTLTVVAGPTAPERLEIVLVARSLSHRRTTTSTASVTVGSRTWTIDDWFNAEPGM
ncbi:RNA-binding domain-containing protein [Mycobacterium sp. 050272]|uniref:AlbA family DNA-binding domain-containing protein n=1 Tax=Mycobacterium sp. 050272 TaxID=3142488 RepID=UPI00318614BF